MNVNIGDVSHAIQLELVVGLTYLLREVHPVTKTVRIPVAPP